MWNRARINKYGFVCYYINDAGKSELVLEYNGTLKNRSNHEGFLSPALHNSQLDKNCDFGLMLEEEFVSKQDLIEFKKRDQKEASFSFIGGFKDELEVHNLRRKTLNLKEELSIDEKSKFKNAEVKEQNSLEEFVLSNKGRIYAREGWRGSDQIIMLEEYPTENDKGVIPPLPETCSVGVCAELGPKNNSKLLSHPLDRNHDSFSHVEKFQENKLEVEDAVEHSTLKFIKPLAEDSSRELASVVKPSNDLSLNA